MAILPIVTVPDPLLKKVSEPVEKVDDKVRAFLDDMLETMYAAPGIGLAAVQVGKLWRILVIDIASDDEEPNPMYFINPVITWTSEEFNTYNEGCLSIPEQYADVERPAECKVDFIDYNGDEKEIHADGLLATCIQHEMDHLNGVVFIDYLSKIKRGIYVRKVKKLVREKEE
ncbi:peptide deformylase [Emcibacteraceae bacterium]|mgnify:FL=1|jgi:peptide deformylase|uniref:peptide deformylase n=1 Tax=Pseudemcibacter sp. TaxID=2943293 RepID=UPI00231A7903|nr:peptide deformylase [Emcibacteraceae bacterium]MDA9771569.1 peptide deformylase [Emcibacteraceae bacterium]MDG1019878.1 peptide deformylase [Emcibacteraceae bacterium]MDG1727572.1 peptide deformylase [Emcibacteraceae bacterium]